MLCHLFSVFPFFLSLFRSFHFPLTAPVVHGCCCPPCFSIDKVTFLSQPALPALPSHPPSSPLWFLSNPFRFSRITPSLTCIVDVFSPALHAPLQHSIISSCANSFNFNFNAPQTSVVNLMCAFSRLSSVCCMSRCSRTPNLPGDDFEHITPSEKAHNICDAFCFNLYIPTLIKQTTWLPYVTFGVAVVKSLRLKATWNQWTDNLGEYSTICLLNVWK